MADERKTIRRQICLTPTMFESARNRAFDLRTTFSEYVTALIEKDLKTAESKEEKTEK